MPLPLPPQSGTGRPAHSMSFVSPPVHAAGCTPAGLRLQQQSTCGHCAAAPPMLPAAPSVQLRMRSAGPHATHQPGGFWARRTSPPCQLTFLELTPAPPPPPQRRPAAHSVRSGGNRRLGDDPGVCVGPMRATSRQLSRRRSKPRAALPAAPRPATQGAQALYVLLGSSDTGNAPAGLVPLCAQNDPARLLALEGVHCSTPYTQPGFPPTCSRCCSPT